MLKSISLRSGKLKTLPDKVALSKASHLGRLTDAPALMSVYIGLSTLFDLTAITSPAFNQIRGNVYVALVNR